MTVNLYPDQAEFKRELYAAIAGGCLRIVGQAPTAFGKTVLAASIARDILDRGKRMIFVVHALTLINQTVERLVENGIPRDKIGVIQADHELTDPDRPIQIASVCTLQRRKIPPANVVIIDEVHRWFKFYDTWLKLADWATVPFLGLSATPWTKGLGKRFSKLIIGATTKQLIDAGRLSDFKVYAPSTPDLSRISTVAGDYHEGELGEVMNQATLVADVIDTWLQRGQNRPTLVFAVDRAHAKHLQAKFKEAGVTGECGSDFPTRRVAQWAERLIPRALFGNREGKLELRLRCGNSHRIWSMSRAGPTRDPAVGESRCRQSKQRNDSRHRARKTVHVFLPPNASTRRLALRASIPISCTSFR